MKLFQGLKRLLICQTLALIIFAAVYSAIIQGADISSILLGGLVASIPSLYFAWRLFRHQGARAANEICQDFYRGEMGKIFLSALLFALVFTQCHVQHLAFFGGFLVVQVTHWLSPLFLTHKGITQ